MTIPGKLLAIDQHWHNIEMTSFDREINKVLLVIAMEAEAKPLLDSLQLQQVVPVQEQSLQYAPFHLYQGEKLALVITKMK